MKARNNTLKLRIKNLTSKKFDVSNFNIYGFKDNWAVIEDKKTNKRGWINEDYTQLINPIYDNCLEIDNNIFIFKKDVKYGMLNSDNKVLIYGLDVCYKFSEGFIKFTIDKKQGFADIDGNILDYGFDYCHDFHNGYAKYFKDGKEGYIDVNGNLYNSCLERI